MEISINVKTDKAHTMVKRGFNLLKEKK